LWREARIGAQVNHPNVCQVFEIGEHQDSLFIAMELLEGEPLATRLRQGPLQAAEAVPIAVDILAALTALHSRGLVHRDLKPSNVFLTLHGTKLLDFGLARPARALGGASEGSTDLDQLTRPGLLVGTPRYMAPEQVRCGDADPRSDLFATGALLFEMLAGRSPFGGSTVVEVLHAILHEQPPALTGSPGTAALDGIIRRALDKDPDRRPESAEAMAAALQRIPLDTAGGVTRSVCAITRLAVLPFRLLRPDPETEFLSFGLADAVSTSLSGLETLVVRSTAAAARFATDQPDLEAIASGVDVDLVVLGTLLRSGDQLRVSAQLVEAPLGTLVGSHTVQSAVGDVFGLQDDLSRRIVDFLALPLAAKGALPRRDVPTSARAYELYLRGVELSRDYRQIAAARDIYLQCLEEDPGFAPAWAQLGRCHRLIGKYLEDREGNRSSAEEALDRALELNPSLAVAHHFYANLEAESGRAIEAMERLLRLAGKRREDPELFAGLVHACRYCGLFEASVAAHEEARRLDPHISTSIAYTLFLMGDLESSRLERGGEPDPELSALALVDLGRRKEALDLLLSIDTGSLPDRARTASGPVAHAEIEALSAALGGGPREDALRAVEAGIAAYSDPEALYLLSLSLALLDQPARAVQVLERCVKTGYFVAPALAREPLLEPARTTPGFEEVLTRAQEGRQRAALAFERANGPSLLGLPPADPPVSDDPESRS